MYHELRRRLSRYAFRAFCHRNAFLLLLCLPAVTLLYALTQRYSAPEVPGLGSEPLRLTAERRPKDSYVIHIWKHGERLKRRFLRSFGKEQRDPFEFCSVRNCRLTTDDSKANESDAILFHLHQTLGPRTLPHGTRTPGQLWIFFTDESPLNTFYATRKYALSDYNGIFNWSMTYRNDSDVPVPYGRTVALTAEEAEVYEPRDHAQTKSRGVAILGSNCGGQNRRWDYVRELQKHIAVDVYGGCGTRECPGHFARDCPVIGDYKFYLAFENSNCAEYVTEKMWWNAYHKETVPVVMGGTRADYERLCPPNSFVHVEDFESPGELARYLSFLLNNDTAYNSFFEWKRRYKVLNEHGYFGAPSLHLCRVCEALNRKLEPPRTYGDLDSFWSRATDCRPPAWVPPIKSH